MRSSGNILRQDESVQEYSGVSTAINKIDYVVPTGKNLFIQQFHVCIAEGDKIIIELQDDGTGLACVANGEGKTGGGVVPFPKDNPLGPISTGSTVRLRRIEGTSGKDWSGSFIGYLEDN